MEQESFFEWDVKTLNMTLKDLLSIKQSQHYSHYILLHWRSFLLFEAPTGSVHFASISNCTIKPWQRDFREFSYLWFKSLNPFAWPSPSGHNITWWHKHINQWCNDSRLGYIPWWACDCTWVEDFFDPAFQILSIHGMMVRISWFLNLDHLMNH